MDSLFGVPTAALAASLAVLTAVVAGWIVWLARRRPILFAIGVRQIPRRRGRSGLIVVGLALGTTIVTASLLTGDLVDATLRAVVAGSIGGVDEVVVSYRGANRPFANVSLRGLAEGQMPSVAGDDFDAAEADRVAAALRDEPGAAGVAGVLIRQLSVADRDRQTASGGFTILAVPDDLPPAFGRPTTPAGRAAPLADLAPGEVYVNTPGAALLDVQSGDALTVYAGNREVPARVRDVVATGDLGGTQATIIARLAWWQAAEGSPGRINHVIVANQGGPESLRWSAPVARRLRSALIDRETADQLFRILSPPAVRSALRNSLDRQSPTLRPRLERLIAALDRPSITDDFTMEIGDPQVLAGLRPILFALGPEARENGIPALNRLGRLTVIELRQLSVDLAGRFAAGVTSVFLVLGLLSIVTGLALVCLIFALLAAERRSELGMARALGTQRGHLIQVFLFEGAVYAVAASIVGVAAGVGVALLMTVLLAGYLADYGVRIAPSVDPRSLVIAGCSGLLVTFATVAGAAWRIARLNVVAAMHDLPSEPASLGQDGRVPSRWTTLVRTLIAGGLLPVLLGAGLVVVSARAPIPAWPAAIGWSAGLIGAVLILGGILRRLRVPRRLRDRIGFSLAGLGLVIAWAQPVAAQGGGGRLDRLSGDLGFLAMAGVAMVLGAAAVLAYNLELLPPIVGAALGRLRRGGAVVAGLRLAALYPARHRGRTGLAIVMFGLVMCLVTTATVLVAGTRQAYGDLDVQAAGFDLRAAVDPRRLPDLPAALDQAPAIGPGAFATVGGQGSLGVEAIQVGAPTARWQKTTVQVVDGGWLDGVGAPLARRAPGYRDDRAVWTAVRDTPGLAVVHGSAVPPPGAAEPPPDPLGSAPLSLRGRGPAGEPELPVTLWLRDPRGGPPVRLTVVGIVDRRVSTGDGVYATPATLRAAGWTPPPPRTYYLTVAPGQQPRQAALGLTRSFSDRGLTAVVLGEELRTIQSLRLLLNELLQGFLGLGLVTGVVALGVIATRAVVERRQQIGVLRAIGLSRRLVLATFLLEASIVAWLGIATGGALGILLASNVVRLIAASAPEIQFGVPWSQLGQLALIAYVATLITTSLPAWQASRVHPAEALRYQ